MATQRKIEDIKWKPPRLSAAPGLSSVTTLHYWRGASGRRYLHNAYALIGCPPLSQANYILVRRYDDGRRVALTFGQTKDDAPTLNLARLRHQGAKCGANEVHIQLLAGSAEERALMEADLVAADAHRRADGAPNGSGTKKDLISELGVLALLIIGFAVASGIVGEHSLFGW